MRLRIIFAMAVALVALAAACGEDGSPPSAGEGRLQVAVSLPLFADFVRQVGGERVDVFAILPSGADPHTFEPTPRDVQRLSQVDVVFINGLGLEGPSLRLIKNSKRPDTPLVQLADRVVRQGVVSAVEGNEDNPHLWLDVALAMRYVEIIRDELSASDSAGAVTYRANAEVYLQQLDALDKQIVELITSIPQERRQLVTSHDAFPYLASYLGLELVAFVAPSPGQEASPRDLADLLEAIEEQGVPAVFVEPQLGAEGRVLQRAAQDADVRVCTLYSDALDDRVQTYIEMMSFNGDEIVRCLGGSNGY